jgi:hypothetical protein
MYNIIVRLEELPIYNLKFSMDISNLKNHQELRSDQGSAIELCCVVGLEWMPPLYNSISLKIEEMLSHEIH